MLDGRCAGIRTPAVNRAAHALALRRAGRCAGGAQGCAGAGTHLLYYSDAATEISYRSYSDFEILRRSCMYSEIGYVIGIWDLETAINVGVAIPLP